MFYICNASMRKLHHISLQFIVLALFTFGFVNSSIYAANQLNDIANSIIEIDEEELHEIEVENQHSFEYKKLKDGGDSGDLKLNYQIKKSNFIKIDGSISLQVIEQSSAKRYYLAYCALIFYA